MNATQEVKLSETAAERDLNDSLAEIYSIIITLDGLEKAYIKDSIPETEYTDICSRLLKQYKSNLSDDTVARSFGDLETFKRQWDVCSPLRQAVLVSTQYLTTPDRMPPRNRTPPGQSPCHHRRSLQLTHLYFHPSSLGRPFPTLGIRLQDPACNRELHNLPRCPEAQHAFQGCPTSIASRTHTIRE